MSFYISFNNLSSFLETSEFANSAENIEAAVADLIEDVSRQNFTAENETSDLQEVADSPENSVLSINYDENITDSISQTSQVSEFNTEKSEIAAQKQTPKLEAPHGNQNDGCEKFQAMLKKFEISLQYKYDLTDVFTTNRETTNSQNLGKLIEKNLNKQRLARQEDFERRFQEKQAENFKEYLKQKRLTSRLRNNSK